MSLERPHLDNIKIGHLYFVKKMDDIDVEVNHIVKICGSNGKTGYNAELVHKVDKDAFGKVGSFYYYYSYDSYIGDPLDFPEYVI